MKLREVTCGTFSKASLWLILLSCSEVAPETPMLKASRIGTALHKDLVENSIAVTSVTRPGIVFGLNDSRNASDLFAFDSTGRARARWRVSAANEDWEAAALGSCGPDDPDRSCLYIGDVGDNDASRPYVTIYRLPEPDPDAGLDSVLDADRINVSYPDFPKDVEAMYVTPPGAIILITKRPIRGERRTLRPALLYRVEPRWGDTARVVAELVDSLPIVPGTAQGRQITDAALSSDGRRLAVRTYREVFVFSTNPATALPLTGVPVTSCNIVGLGERQGEGIGWWWDGVRLLLTSEGVNAPLFVIACG